MIIFSHRKYILIENKKMRGWGGGGGRKGKEAQPSKAGAVNN